MSKANYQDDAAPAAPAPPCAMVVFGASGDLTKRLLVPALYNLARVGLLPEKFQFLGVARGETSLDEFRAKLRDAVEGFTRSRGAEAADFDAAAWDRLAGAMDFISADLTKPDDYKRIAAWLEQAEKHHGTAGNALFYLATTEALFGTAVENLAAAGLTDERGGQRWRRIVIEKPFGHDYESAQALDRRILRHVAETQVYRIDHYLGKETVQNIMILRFANGIFEPLWNRDHIDHIQITVAETVGVESRGDFYDRTGALRDMVPNHLFQLLAMTAMEPPINFSADAVRGEKVKVLDALHFAPGEDARHAAVRGQYQAGAAGGRRYANYTDEADVAHDSTTETYVALKLMLDNWRWAGMPFYLRTGKALTKRGSEVVVQFKRAPFVLFRDTPVDRLHANRLIIHIQPDEGVSLQFGAKIPGPKVTLGQVSMNFKYRDYFDAAPSTGYETLVYDCMIGDATLFQRADSVEAGWRVVEPVLKAWRDDPRHGLARYAAGSAGPREADDLLARDGRAWHGLTETPDAT
jgi:glucose-6-phosphate 1-dehydrogenase